MKTSRHDLDELNQKCYDCRYAIWDRFPFPTLLPELILNHHNPNLGNQVLDIGSGTGLLAKWLQEQGFTVLCLDPSPQMVCLCRQKNLKCEQTTFQEYRTTQSFSIVLAILSLIHVPKSEWPAELDKIANLLSANGLFVLALIEGLTEGVEESPTGFPRFFARFTYSELIDLTQSRFHLLDFCKVPGPQTSYLIFAFRKK